EADLIVHVRDIAHLDSEAQRRDVEDVLEKLGLGDRLEDEIIEVLNKIDLLDADSRQFLRAKAARGKGQVLASALTGEGLDDLLAAIERRLAKGSRTVSLSVALVDGAAISWLYDHGQVLGRRDDERFAHLRVNLDSADLARFHRRQAG
ncbi:MAG: GTPase HflX, partial [Proteobacteria bacterium]|nr:GTPase HflX [Pseudomonadota bacterium]